MATTWGNIQCELRDPDNLTVIQEVINAYWIDMRKLVQSMDANRSNLNDEEKKFASDMDKIYESQAAVTNTSSTHPKGP